MASPLIWSIEVEPDQLTCTLNDATWTAPPLEPLIGREIEPLLGQRWPVDATGRPLPGIDREVEAARARLHVVGEMLTDRLAPDARAHLLDALDCASPDAPAHLVVELARSGTDPTLSETILCMPWELLVIDGEMPAADGRLLVTRSIAFGRPLGRPSTCFPLTACFAHPFDVPPLDRARVIDRFRACLGLDAVNEAPTGRLADLVTQLRRTPRSILFMSGHGNAGRFLFEGLRGESDPIPAPFFARTLADVADRPVLLLSMCHGMASHPEHGAVAAAVHREGATVVAYRGLVHEEIALIADLAYLTALKQGASPLVAYRQMVEALRRIPDGETYMPFAWAQLACFMRPAEAVCTTAPDPRRQDGCGGSPAPASIVGQSPARARFWTQWKAGGQRMLVAGPPGIGKTRFVESMRPHLHADSPTIRRLHDLDASVPECGPFVATACVVPPGWPTPDVFWLPRMSANDVALLRRRYPALLALADADWTQVEHAADGRPGFFVSLAAQLSKSVPLSEALNTVSDFLCPPLPSDEGMAHLAACSALIGPAPWGAIIALGESKTAESLRCSGWIYPAAIGAKEDLWWPLMVSRLSRCDPADHRRLLAWYQSHPAAPEAYERVWHHALLAGELDVAVKSVLGLAKDAVARGAAKQVIDLIGRTRERLPVDHPDLDTLWVTEGRLASLMHQVGPSLRAALEVRSNHPIAALILADLALDDGDLTQSEAHLRHALSEEAPDDIRGAVLEIWAALDRTRGAGDAARARLDEALSIARTSGALYEMAGVLADAGELEAARRTIDEAIEIAETQLPADHPILGAMWGRRGTIRLRGGTPRKARDALVHALGISLVAGGQETAETANIRVELGNALEAIGDFGGARIQIEHALDTQIACHGERHPQIGTTLHGLARLNRDDGRLAEAESLLRRSIAIWDALPIQTSTSPAVASTYHELGRVLQGLARPHEARVALERALTIKRQSPGGTKHPAYAVTLHVLASVLRDLDELNEARALLEEALHIKSATLPAGHPSLAATHHALAYMHSIQGNLVRATLHLESSLAIKREVIGSDAHPDIAASLHMLGVLHKKSGRLLEAAQSLEQALDIFEQTLGSSIHPAIAASLHALAGVMAAQNRMGEALEHIARAVQIKRQLYGAHPHPDLAVSLHQWGVFLHRRGALQEAATQLREALAIEEAVYGHRRRQGTATTEALLGRVLLSMGHVDEGREHLRHAADVLSVHLGPDHDEVLTLRSRLVSV